MDMASHCCRMYGIIKAPISVENCFSIDQQMAQAAMALRDAHRRGLLYPRFGPLDVAFLADRAPRYPLNVSCPCNELRSIPPGGFTSLMMNFPDMFLRLGTLPPTTTLIVSIDFASVANRTSVRASSASLASEKLVPQTVSRIGRIPHYSWWLYRYSEWQDLRLRGSLNTQYKQHS